VTAIYSCLLFVVCLLLLQLESLPAIVAMVWSDDKRKQLEGTTKFRKLLLMYNPHIEKVIQCFVVARFLEFLHRDDFPKLRVCFKLFYLLEIYVVWCS